jgi:hypothetical protein
MKGDSRVGCTVQSTNPDFSAVLRAARPAEDPIRPRVLDDLVQKRLDKRPFTPLPIHHQLLATLLAENPDGRPRHGNLKSCPGARATADVRGYSVDSATPDDGKVNQHMHHASSMLI